MKSCYIHIPFCSHICTYCDFCKMYYNRTWVDKYLEALEEEIKLNYNSEKLSTIYIGGGTPTCLSEQQLERLLSILEMLNKQEDIEYTIETNVESLSLEKIKLLRRFGINRVSIGVQSIIEKHIKYLGRQHSKDQVVEVINNLKQNGIDNINVDLIYALENQTMEDLRIDLEFLISLDIKHISTYSLIIEENTKLGIRKVKEIDEDLDFQMYNNIRNILNNNNFIHYEISNFSKEGYQSKHNLTYWNNEEYYGFGLGASGYVNNIRYDNTKSLNKYLEGNYRLEEEYIDEYLRLENEFILGLRKVEGINKNKFNKKFNKEITEINVVKDLLEQNKLIDRGEYISIPEDKIYVSNSILINFIGGFYGED